MNTSPIILICLGLILGIVISMNFAVGDIKADLNIIKKDMKKIRGEVPQAPKIEDLKGE